MKYSRRYFSSLEELLTHVKVITTDRKVEAAFITAYGNLGYTTSKAISNDFYLIFSSGAAYLGFITHMGTVKRQRVRGVRHRQATWKDKLSVWLRCGKFGLLTLRRYGMLYMR